MVSKTVTIKVPQGLHFRPAGKISEEALKYECDVSFRQGERIGSLKSFLGILAAGIRKDTKIDIICDGPDEEEALNNLVTLIEEKL